MPIEEDITCIFPCSRQMYVVELQVYVRVDDSYEISLPLGRVGQTQRKTVHSSVLGYEIVRVIPSNKDILNSAETFASIISLFLSPYVAPYASSHSPQQCTSVNVWWRCQ
jgi:hypothetical protein